MRGRGNRGNRPAQRCDVMPVDIPARTSQLLHELVRFKLSYVVSRYLSDRASIDWRGFELEQHEAYPIKGCGVIATRKLIDSWSIKKETILHLEEDLAPEETGSEIDSFPRDSVATIYVFSLLEGFGNQLCDFVSPSYRKVRQAWHHGVYGDADLEDQEVLEKMEHGFRQPFALSCAVPKSIVAALVRLKRQRNAIVHELRHVDEFEIAFRSVVAIACFLGLHCDSSVREIRVFPWEDFHGKFAH